MTGLLSHSAAEIIRHLLIDMGYGTYPTNNDTWPVYVGIEPSTPDQVVTVTGDNTVHQGRTHFDGEVQDRLGIAIRIRSVTYRTGYAKARAVLIALDKSLYDDLVTIGSVTYRVHAWSRSGSVQELGKQSGTKRYHFSIRGTVTITEVEDDEVIIEDDDDMLDFEDIGGVYSDSSAITMSANVTKLNAFLAAVSRPAIRFGGPRNATYNDKRVPGTAYFNGSIAIPSLKPVIIDGGNSIIDVRTITGATAAITLGEGGAGTERLLRDFRLNSNGSGISCNSPGRGTILQNIRMYPVCSGCVLDYDEFTDAVTAGYGLKIYNGAGVYTPDGIRVEGLQIFDCGGHGIFIPDGMNAGTFIGRCHNSAGTGFKARKLNGCHVEQFVSEYNYAWGNHLETMGTGNYAGGLSGGNTDVPNDVDFWLETNNWRGSSYVSAGHGVRQMKMRGSGAVNVAGHTGWGSNKVDIDEGSRNNCVFESGRWIECTSFTPTAQLSDIAFTLPGGTASVANNNLATVWPNAAYRPVVEDVAGEIVVTLPVGCFDNAVGSYAYWRPWGLLSLFTSQANDVCTYQAELSGNATLTAWCVGREESSPSRQLSNFCELQIAPVSAAKTWLGLYNEKRRWCMGRVVMGEVRTDVTPALILWAAGYNDQTGSYPQSAEMSYTIHNWKFYVHRVTGVLG